MLISTRMASIPSSPHRSPSNMKDLQNLFENPLVSCVSSSATPPPLQFFNMRVTERLHRYRTLKRHWHEVAAAAAAVAVAAKHETILPSKSDSRSSSPDILLSTQDQIVEPRFIDVKDCIPPITTIGMKDISGKNPIDFYPLHSRIQDDLIKLRRLIKETQKKRIEIITSKPSTNSQTSIERPMNILLDNQDANHITDSENLSPFNKAKLVARVKISGAPIRPSTFPQSNMLDKKVASTNYTITTYSQSLKQRQKVKEKINSKTFSICRSRINACLPSDSTVHRSMSTKKPSNTPPKINQNTSSKQTPPYRLSMAPTLKKKQSSSIKRETLLPPIRRISKSEQPTTCSYTYAASTSSATPHVMKLNRNRSLLPILLTSIPCIGTQTQEYDSETYADNDEDDYYNLLHYKQLINYLPKPIISIQPRYNQDDYGMLLEQLDHIRETMPDSHVYDNYTRVC